MNLSANVVYDSLPSSFSARMLGTPKDGALLGRPELLERTARELRDGHLYVAREEQLPRRLDVRPVAVLVAMGTGSRLRHFSERCCVIHVGEGDLFQLFNAIQRTYDRFDAWERDLEAIIADDADIDAMLERSAGVFENPLTVIDAQFRYLGRWQRAEADDASALAGLGASAILDPENLRDFLANHDLEMEVDQPFLLELLGTTTLNSNLIDEGEYLGCLTVYYERRPWRPSDMDLARFLTSCLVRAIRRQASLPDASGMSLGRILRDLVEELPLDGIERAMLEAQGEERSLVCVRIRLDHRLNQLPIGYVCAMVERAFPRAIAFEHHRSSVVAFVDVEPLMDETGSYREQLLERLAPFFATLSAKAGVSDPMHDPSKARLYFLQASTTLENGRLVHPDRDVYEYQDYALVGMVVNALGDMPVDMLFSPGLRRLAEHDERSQTSYLETLRALLEHSMSVTKTARALYLHRSTLMERLRRIERELDENLDDPDVRLRLQIVLKALSIRKELGEGL